VRALAVFKREYLQVVRKKSFLILTLLAPFLMAGLIVVPALASLNGLGAKRVALVDATGALAADVESEQGRETAPPGSSGGASGPGGRRARTSAAGALAIEYVGPGREVETTLRAALARLQVAAGTDAAHLDGVFYVPAGALEDPGAKLTYYTRASVDFITQERMSRIVNRALARRRLESRGVSALEIEKLLEPAVTEGIQVSPSGSKRGRGDLEFLGAFVFVFLLLLPMILYGQEIMRGVIQEKTDRVVEILISSMSALELLSGKVLGMAAAGLTQIGIWTAMAAGAVGVAGGLGSLAGIDFWQYVSTRTVAFFLLFYVLGYLVYACLYAVTGAVSNSEKEAQQVLAPLVLVLMAPWFLALPILQSPESRFAVTLSLVPIYTPITMFLRLLVSDPPLWQIALSIALSAGTIYILFTLTAKIFRVGILIYGKRPTIPEIWRWLKAA
jgi:ABC-2 type transport system permease protein